MNKYFEMELYYVRVIRLLLPTQNRDKLKKNNNSKELGTQLRIHI